METIRLKVVCEDQLGVDIVMKRTTSFAIIKAGYSNIVKLPISHLKFVFDGQRVGDDDTPETLNMETDDMIEANMESGGVRIDSHSPLYIDSERSLVGFRERDRDEKLLEEFDSILHDQATADFTITCNGKNFPVHRAIISARSRVLRAMIQSNMVEAKTGVHNIDHPPIDDKCLEEMIHFIYTGRLSGNDIDIQALCFAADKYDIKGLVRAICTKLEVGEGREGQVWYGRHDQVADMLIAGDLHNIEQLKKMAIQRIKINKEILADKDFKAKILHYPKVLFELLQGSINNVELFN